MTYFKDNKALDISLKYVVHLYYIVEEYMFDHIKNFALNNYSIHIADDVVKSNLI